MAFEGTGFGRIEPAQDIGAQGQVPGIWFGMFVHCPTPISERMSRMARTAW